MRDLSNMLFVDHGPISWILGVLVILVLLGQTLACNDRLPNPHLLRTRTVLYQRMRLHYRPVQLRCSKMWFPPPQEPKHHTITQGLKHVPFSAWYALVTTSVSLGHWSSPSLKAIIESIYGRSQRIEVGPKCFVHPYVDLSHQPIAKRVTLLYQREPDPQCDCQDRLLIDQMSTPSERLTIPCMRISRERTLGCT
jgi:hypothetical protein